MNEKEITKQIDKELRRIANLEEKIASIKFDIRATKKAIRMWKGKLKTIKKGK